MKSIIASFLLLLSVSLYAQDDIVQNGSFEKWRLKEFLKCCGRNTDQPWYWGMTEYLTGLNYNKFVFRETDSALVHSGEVCAKLYSDTTYLNNLVLIPGFLAYGGMTDSFSTAVTVSPVVRSTGYPVFSNPSMLNFYMMADHNVTDTPSYVYLFSKWNTTLQKEDTLAYAKVDIPDADENMNQWVSYTDTIHYTMPGTADTARIIFFGGRFGNSSLQGNATYLDDVTFYYPTTGLVSLDGSAVLQVYPNPASNVLTIKTGQYKPGNNFSVFDLTGRFIKQVAIENYTTTLNISALQAGNYLYRLADKTGTILTQGKFEVLK